MWVVSMNFATLWRKIFCLKLRHKLPDMDEQNLKKETNMLRIKLTEKPKKSTLVMQSEQVLY